MKRERRYLLERVANLYFKEDMKQELIAKKLGISRSNISRLLNEAKKKGIVEIKINYENKDATYRRELSEKIEKNMAFLKQYSSKISQQRKKQRMQLQKLHLLFLMTE